MILRHATTKQRLARIQTEGLRVACADPTAKIKGVWLHTKSQSSWAVVHTIHKHHAQLDEVVVLELNVPRSKLTRFRSGLWYCREDIPASAIITVIEGNTFGQSASA